MKSAKKQGQASCNQKVNLKVKMVMKGNSKLYSPQKPCKETKSTSSTTFYEKDGSPEVLGLAQKAKRKNRRQHERTPSPCSKNGKWTPEEHKRLLEALDKYGNNWKQVATALGTRTRAQIRSHVQKHFQKVRQNALKELKRTNKIKNMVFLITKEYRNVTPDATQSTNKQALNTHIDLNTDKPTQQSIFQNTSVMSGDDVEDRGSNERQQKQIDNAGELMLPFIGTSFFKEEDNLIQYLTSPRHIEIQTLMEKPDDFSMDLFSGNNILDQRSPSFDNAEVLLK